MTKETLRRLIEDGVLPVDTVLTPSRKDLMTTARVAKDGLVVNGRVYASPSGAAYAITGYQVNGWMFWHLPDGTALGSIRRTVRGRPSEGVN